MLFKLGTILATMARVRAQAAKSGRCWLKFGRGWPNFAMLGEAMGKVGQHWPETLPAPTWPQTALEVGPNLLSSTFGELSGDALHLAKCAKWVLSPLRAPKQLSRATLCESSGNGLGVGSTRRSPPRRGEFRGTAALPGFLPEPLPEICAQGPELDQDQCHKREPSYPPGGPRAAPGDPSTSNSVHRPRAHPLRVARVDTLNGPRPASRVASV